jgi:hypothetical protein
VQPFLCNNNSGLPALTTDNKCTNQVFYVWLVYLQTICAKQVLETCLSPNNDISICLLNMRHSWTKKAFWDVNNKKRPKSCSSFHLSSLITFMAYLCSQWTPNVLMTYIMFDWSTYRLFVLKQVWKRDFFQIVIFRYVSTTWGMFETKTRFETWITRNDEMVFVSPFLFNNPYGLPVPTTDNIYTNQVFYDWLVLNSGRKCDSK